MSNKKISLIAILAIAYTFAGLTYYSAMNNKVLAAGKTVTVAPTSLAASSATEVTYSYVSTAEYAIADTVVITAAAGVTVADCASSTNDADGDVTTDASSAPVVAGQTYTYTFSAPTTTASSGGVDFCVSFSAVTGNYSVSFTDSKATPSNNDFGAALLYIGDANDVTVTAQVQPVLTFAIRNSADDANINVCNLGVLNPAAVNTCAYRLKIGTNANSGYVVSVTTDGDLRRSGSGDVADSEDLDTVTDESGVITSGTEAYGIALVGNTTSTGAAVTESTTGGYNFSTDDTPLPLSAQTLYTATTQNSPSTTSHSALVTHRATTDAGSNTGNYQQIVTYTVVANF